MRSILPCALALVVLCTANLAAQQQPETARINADRVNVRKAPSLDSAIVRTLSKGTVVTVVFRDSTWARIELSELSLTGWVHQNLLTMLTAAPATANTASSSAAAAAASALAAAPASPNPVPSPPPAPPPPPAADPLAGAPTARPLSAPPSPAAVSASRSTSASHLQLFGGITLAQTFDDGVTTTTISNRGITAGFSVEVPVAPGFAVAPTLMYVGEHESILDTSFGIPDTSTVQADHAGFALLLRPLIGQGSMRLFVQAGPEAFAYFYENESVSEGGLAFTFSSWHVHMDAGLLAGGGVQLGPLVLAANYELRLTDGHEHAVLLTAGLTF